MKTGVFSLGQVGLSLVVCLGLAACNKNEEFYAMEGFDRGPATTAGAVDGGSNGSSDNGSGSTQGGVDGGLNGGTSGGATTGSSTGGSTTGGTTVGGSTTGGSTEGGTQGGVTGGTTGVVYEDKTESFNQTAEVTKKLDIVWIVDNSGSMADEQAALGFNFDVFINEFINRNVDFKMAITTTDVSSAAKKGLMVAGSEEKLNSAAAQANPTQFIADFKRMVKVGTSGSGNEKGLEASEGFINRYGSSFLRPDAYLTVVVISDEEDQSSKAVDFYTDLLKNSKAEAGLAKVYSIVDVNKTNRGSGVTTGYERYAKASQNTAGIVGNIRDNFYHVLSDMGEAIINLLDSFALSQEPVAGTLKVFVNGTERTDYSYDSSSHSIKFAQRHLPPVGAKIEVSYKFIK